MDDEFVSAPKALRRRQVEEKLAAGEEYAVEPRGTRLVHTRVSNDEDLAVAGRSLAKLHKIA